MIITVFRNSDFSSLKRKGSHYRTANAKGDPRDNEVDHYSYMRQQDGGLAMKAAEQKRINRFVEEEGWDLVHSAFHRIALMFVLAYHISTRIGSSMILTYTIFPAHRRGLTTARGPASLPAWSPRSSHD
jgi:hypothetical protein